MSQKRKKETVLAIFAHADDELGCAGTMANHVDAGDDVILAFLTKGENITSLDGNLKDKVEERKTHTDKIQDLLGVRVKFLDFKDSNIEYNVENGYIVAELIKEIKPTIIISWSKFETMGGGHPDHRNTSDLVRDAISYARYKREGSKFEPHREMMSYYTYVNPLEISNHQIEAVDVSHQVEKIQSFINIYKAAYGSFPVEDFKFNSMKYFAQRSGATHVEVFKIIQRRKIARKLLT
ncbi:MAG: PIG-L family deacetylase [Candidatus Heimdallarchaeota archaeon]|nr:PIG-L family deacetylase [Candidatus Heimdallarchaeota archaeon]